MAANSLLEGAADRWLLDSGVSCHMSHDRASFVSLRDHKVTIQIGKKGGNVVSEGVGDVDLCLDVCGRLLSHMDASLAWQDRANPASR